MSEPARASAAPPSPRASAPRIRAILLRVLTLLGLATGFVPAQDPVELLREEVRELRRQNAALQTRVEELEENQEEARDDPQEFERRVARLVQEEIDRRPLNVYPDPGADELSLWEKVNRGLILTGFFRMRAEWRHRNTDFRGDGDAMGSELSNALDDEGVRLNGRFRLGFGARIADLAHGRIESLTEFQTSGDLTNNSFFNLSASGGPPRPVRVPLFQAPFEEVALYRGYLDFDDLVAEDVRIRVGRQNLTFGNEFLLGDDQFHGGRTHDAVFATWDDPTIPSRPELSLFYAKLAEFDDALNPASLSTDFDDDYLLGILGSLRPTDELLLEAALLYFSARNTGVAGTDIFVTGSYPALAGATLTGTTGRFFTVDLRGAYGTEAGGGWFQSSLEVAGQYGTSSLPEYSDIRGHALELVLNYWFDDPRPLYSDLTARGGLHPIVHLGYQYAQGSSGDRQGFQMLFPDRHMSGGHRYDVARTYFPSGARAGTMDILPLENLHLLRAAVTVSPTAESEIGLAYVASWADDGDLLPDRAGNPTDFYGQEIDLFYTYAPRFESNGDLGIPDPYVPEIIFSANLSAFFPGEAGTAYASRALSVSGQEFQAGDDIAFLFYFQASVAF